MMNTLSIVLNYSTKESMQKGWKMHLSKDCFSNKKQSFIVGIISWTFMGIFRTISIIKMRVFINTDDR